ncbi:hypothetical protein ACFSJY_04015 [Thalassotalea euphylliae]|uniref:hypothetical protein n=1 Tax=Thalassotalea euphylliae TaxID=1655234 RepID=UPI003644359E
MGVLGKQSRFELPDTVTLAKNLFSDARDLSKELGIKISEAIELLRLAEETQRRMIAHEALERSDENLAGIGSHLDKVELAIVEKQIG